MNHNPFPMLDPELRRRTRRSHIALFTLGSLLIIPAAFVLYLFGFIVKEGDLMNIGMEHLGMILSAVIPSLTGSLAWTALGILLMRPAYPSWHRVCWSFVELFGITTIPCSILWICLEPSKGSPFTLVAGFAFLTAIYSVVVATRNLKLSRLSLIRAGKSDALEAS